uniref:CSON006146 protein n=1 Tax=Culicoides sonorensis TaxID=179676 RepID=A0A336LYM9_CULSO
MKPITFEVIRNLLKTKKKGKDKGIDQSFKRSDSFKRISIRKSYLDRGRRRNVLRSKTVLDLNDIEIKSNSSSLERRNKSRDGSPDECSSQEPSIIAELERKDASIDEKIRALQEINDRYMRENQKGKKVEKKSAIPKPPRTSKLKDQNPKDIKVDKCENSSKPSTLETSKENICDNSPSKENKNIKTVSQINILFTGDTNEKPSSNKNELVNKRHSQLLDDDQSSFYSVSTFTLDSQAYQDTASTRHSNYSRSISYTQGIDSNKRDKDASSFLTFSTYCQSIKSDTNDRKNDKKNGYLETSFDGPDTNTSKSNNETGNKQGKNVKNISTTSLVYEPTYVKPVINTQTFKMVKSKSREGVIIKIPAVENEQREGDDDNDKDKLNRQSSNDSAVDLDSNSSVEKLNQIQEKSTMNATITYEKICKAFEKQEAKYKKNPKKDRRKDLRRERLETHLNTQKPFIAPPPPPLENQEMLSDEGLIASTESLEISSPKTGTFELKSPRHSTLELPSINNTGTYDKTTSDKFIFPKDYFEEENNISYRVGTDVESPESTAVPLKIKENPFTKNKEISAVTTSRIWKQVNLGQDEEIVSSHPYPVPPPLRPKNESFKSMSSHDSGFSLTLTKPKNLFRRKSKKQRRKPKLSVSRDGYFKRVMVVQHNSTKRKKNNETGNKQGKNVKNISTTSLVYEPTYVKPVINTQTFKMVKSKSREGVIIKIPAVENEQREGDDDNDKDKLNRQSSNDSAVEADSNSSVEKLNQIQEKSTMNATITYEKICKAFEKQEAKYKKNPKKDRRKDLRRERLETHLNTQKPFIAPPPPPLENQEMLSDEGLIASTESLEISSPKTGTFELKSPRHSTLELPSINNTGTYDKTTSDKFIFPKDYFEEENNISYRVGTDVESPEGTAVPLKIKENPFTKNKEISAVTTSRIWKQVNLGQDEEIVSSNPYPVPPPLRPKNESFKSMSSHDSGFSLTLTKPKNLFRRKSKKQRRKPKLSVSRDGYFKRVMVVQHNSTKRKKNNKKQRPQGKDVFKSLYDDNWTKLGGNYMSAEMLSGNEFENQSILRDFENFCNRNKHFNKEINDLEEFYEEHLKRLKHYYLQRKQMNEVAIREFYRDYANDEEFYDAHIVSRNDTFRFKNTRNGRESPEYLFPYPDKRIALGKKRSKMQFPEVRTFKSHILGSKYSSEAINNRNQSLENLKSNKDFNQFPYWKLSRKVSKRERVAPKFKDKFIDPFETEKNEVSLADIFPSVNDPMQKNNDKDTDKQQQSDSDEFSEQEFIANCLGDDLYCSTCDKNNSDCECYIDDDANDQKQMAKNSNSKMKSIKRRRSKKRLRKNHSTLRRDHFYGIIL